MKRRHHDVQPPISPFVAHAATWTRVFASAGPTPRLSTCRGGPVNSEAGLAQGVAHFCRQNEPDAVARDQSGINEPDERIIQSRRRHAMQALLQATFGEQVIPASAQRAKDAALVRRRTVRQPGAQANRQRTTTVS